MSNFRTNSGFQANEATASAMLQKRNIVTKPSIIEGVQVRISRGDKKFYWERPVIDEATGEEYYPEYLIANTNLLTEYNAQKAMDLFVDGDYQGAINQGLSLRVSPEEADKIEAALGMCNAKISYYTNKEGIEVLRVEKLAPKAPEKAQSFSFDYFEKKNKAALTPNVEGFEEESPVITKKNVANVAASAAAATAGVAG